MINTDEGIRKVVEKLTAIKEINAYPINRIWAMPNKWINTDANVRRLQNLMENVMNDLMSKIIEETKKMLKDKSAEGLTAIFQINQIEFQRLMQSQGNDGENNMYKCADCFITMGVCADLLEEKDA